MKNKKYVLTVRHNELRNEDIEQKAFTLMSDNFEDIQDEINKVISYGTLDFMVYVNNEDTEEEDTEEEDTEDKEDLKERIRFLEDKVTSLEMKEEELEEESERLKEKNEELEEESERLKEKNEEIKDDLESISEDIEEIEDLLTTLKDRIDWL